MMSIKDRISESELKQIVAESVKKVLWEANMPQGATLFYESALLVAQLSLIYKNPNIYKRLIDVLSSMYDDVKDIEIYFKSQNDFEFIVTENSGFRHSLTPQQIYRIGWDMSLIPH